jgi:hypothetical protein
MGRLAAWLAAVLGGIALAIFATTPPSPKGQSVAMTVFSAERAMVDVRQIAISPHPTGSAEDEKVRGYLAARMQALGMEVSASRGGLVDARGTAKYARWTGHAEPPKPLINLIGVLPGRDRSRPAVMLMAHHDTVWGSPGAADDTAGVAATLEVVRAIRTAGQPRRDLVVLFTDGEELGLQGARAFFAGNPLRQRIGAIVNMEARGGGGRTAMFQTSPGNGASMALFAQAVARPSAGSLAVFLYRNLPNDTDLTPTLKGPYTSYNFAFIGRSALYHSPRATPDRLDQGALQDMGDQVLGLTRGLLSADSIPSRAPDVVFFDLFGLGLMIYPAWVGWVLLGIAGLGLALVVRRNGGAGLGAGAARMTGLIGLSATLLWAFNQLTLKAGPTNYYDRLAAIPRLEALALLVTGGAVALVIGSWKPAKGGVAGAALPLLVLAIVAQALAPTAGYGLVVPLALVCLALAAADRLPVPVGLSLLAAFGALISGYMLALAHFIMQGVGSTLPMAAAMPLAVAMFALLPLWPALAPRVARLMAGVLLLAAAGLALSIHFAPLADTVAAYTDTKH